jgi:hypothetical protein
MKDGQMLKLLPRNWSGRPILTVPAARKLAAISGREWYVAPYATVWTVGRSIDGTNFHVIDEKGEPIRFAELVAAGAYLEEVLGVEKWHLCGPPRSEAFTLCHWAGRLAGRGHAAGPA